MSKQFHSFRAPLPSRTPPTASAHLRKAWLRLSRDLHLRIRSSAHRRRLVLLFLSLLLLCLPFRLLLLSRAGRLSHGQLSLLATRCACPLAGTSTRFARNVLSHGAFVARASFLRYERSAVVLRVDELFRGPLRAPQFEVVARDVDARACFSGGPHPGVDGSNDAWLVVAGGIAAWHPRNAAPANQSVLLPGPLAGPGCPHPALRHDSAIYADRMVWMTPWALLTKEVVDGIREDAGEGDLWWRRKQAWIEFAAAVRRAGNATAAQRHVRVEQPPEKRPRPAVEVVREAVEDVQEATGAEGEWWLEDGVSLIAACKDRSSTLSRAIRSWTAVRGVHEVLLVDWSSEPPISYSMSKEVLDGDRITLVRVSGQNDWVLSRAYNLAARLASYSRLMKVDCDTFLEPDIIETHPLPRDKFYAGDWRQLESGVSDELHVNGLLYVYRDDYLSVGGYDERITTYGWDDSDISERLASIRNFTRFDYSKVRHIAHPASLRVVNQRTTSLLPPENPHAAAVEIQRNRLLLTRFHIPAWSATPLHTLWNVVPVAPVDNKKYFQGSKGPGRVFEVTAANEVTAVSSLVSDADALDVAKRAVRLILYRYGVQFLPRTLTLDFYKELITKVAFPEHYAEVVLAFRGGCASRLLAYASSNQAATGARLKDAKSEIADSSYVWPPLPYRGWRLQGLWRYPDRECTCKFSAVFDAREEEIISTWTDTANPLQPSVAIKDRQPSVDVTTVLKGFDTRAKEKIISKDLLKWTRQSARQGKHSKARILMDDLACDLDPQHVSEHRRQLMRAQLRRLAPTKEIQETVSTSLMKKSPTILDSQLLAKDRWPVLVGSDFASTITNTFTSQDLQTMAAAWGATTLLAGQRFHRLDWRAASLTVAVHISENAVRSPDQLTPTQSQALNETVTTLSRRIERLFIGCLSRPSKYLEAYPELSLILAGFLSCGTCV